MRHLHKMSQATAYPWWRHYGAARQPDFELPGYLKRWALDPSECCRTLEDGHRLYLHNIVAPDVPVHHCHPRQFRALVLDGSYIEDRAHIKRHAGDRLTIGVRQTRRVEWGSLNIIPDGSSWVAHFIKAVFGDVWTLVEVGPECHHWGFYLPDSDGNLEFVPYEVSRIHPSGFLDSQPEPVYGPLNPREASRA